MTSSVTKAFRELLLQLPRATQEQAARTYALWRTEPYHNSLQFKRVSQRQPIYSVRVGLGYRALGLREGDHVYWFWIGPHAEYDELLKRLEYRRSPRHAWCACSWRDSQRIGRTKAFFASPPRPRISQPRRRRLPSPRRCLPFPVCRAP